MQGKAVPASLTGVLEPLREADEYQRLQLVRQRGLYNLLTGSPFLFFMLSGGGSFQWLGSLVDTKWLAGALQGALFVLFLLSCFTPKLLLPWVRQHRPDWVSVFMDASLVKRALEKLFWIQAGFYFAAFFLVLIGLIVVSFFGWPVFGLVLAALHVPAMITLALHSRKTGDDALKILYFAMIPLAGLAFLPSAGFPFLQAVASFAFALTAPPIVAGLVRAIAPRRWLIR